MYKTEHVQYSGVFISRASVEALGVGRRALECSVARGACPGAQGGGRGRTAGAAAGGAARWRRRPLALARRQLHQGLPF